ncbi:hypothetical protein ABW20_dc0106333 [Dactylellina cionopaga]|nr:hypothetical protein ABW20_dc0106333 [Dactylellina cionopaga]
MKDILRCRRVCQRWKTVIDTDPILLWKTYRSATVPASASSTDEMGPDWNPMLFSWDMSGHHGYENALPDENLRRTVVSKEQVIQYVQEHLSQRQFKSELFVRRPCELKEMVKLSLDIDSTDRDIFPVSREFSCCPKEEGSIGLSVGDLFSELSLVVGDMEKAEGFPAEFWLLGRTMHVMDGWTTSGKVCKIYVRFFPGESNQLEVKVLVMNGVLYLKE